MIHRNIILAICRYCAAIANSKYFLTFMRQQESEKYKKRANLLLAFCCWHLNARVFNWFAGRNLRN